MRQLWRRFSLVIAGGALIGCGSGHDAEQSAGCTAQVTGTYDFVVLARLRDGTLWVAPNSTRFPRVTGPEGPFVATDSAASGSSAYDDAIGCAIVSGGVWCFPLVDPLLDSTHLGAGLGRVRTDTARRVVTSQGDGALPLEGATQLAGGMNGSGASFCAVGNEGKVWCWGNNPGGLLGHADPDGSSYARAVVQEDGTELDHAEEVRVGFDSTCARKSDGSVWCWGDDELGQLGSPLSTGSEQSVHPVLVQLPSAASRLAASPGNTQCAILSDGRVTCWGRNEYAQAGASSDRQTVTPTIVQASRDGTAFAGARDLAPDHGMRAMCANTLDSGLWCWGDVLQDDPTGIGSPYPISFDAGAGRAPLSAYGARDGRLLYTDAHGALVVGAGGPASDRQPPCPEP